VQNLLDNVVNDHSGKKYTVSTVRKFPLKVWETAVIRGGLFGGFSTKNFLYVEETIGEYPDLIMAAHARVGRLAKQVRVEDWQMTFEEIRERQSDAARLA
jgi:hypothetical protein